MSDPSTEQTLAGARETRPSMPAPAPEPPRDRPLRDRILDVAALYPESRSAIIPALRLAQEEHGWLPEEAFDEVADALDLTPGYCKAVASFYDMFRLQPVGRHEVCVCTSLACTLVGAADTLRAFEQELGVEAGRIDARTACSRCAPSSATAAAAGARWSRSTSATTSRCPRTRWRR